jgi:toxin YoeB
VTEWKVVYTAQAKKDAKKIAKAGLKDKTLKLLEVLKANPYKNPPPYEKLVGDLAGAYSRRINIQHRLVYQIYQKEKIVKIIRMWTHYE